MASAPTGTVTFLFTDIEGSTRLWELHPGDMALALARHDQILRQAIEANGGHIFRTAGDAFFAAFTRASDALNSAADAQIALHKEPWPGTTPILVRMTLHTGVVEHRDADYFGPSLNRISRMLSAAHGGQTILSDATYELVRGFLRPDIRLQDLGIYTLRDLLESERLWQVAHPDLPENFPPLRVQSATVHDLPQTLSQIVGRTREVNEAETILRQSGSRLVTITGFGGMGKSRLAMEVAKRCLPQFPDGVWWVELDSVPSAEALFTRLAENLHLPLSKDEAIRSQVCRSLRERRLLLALDNTEQIPDAAEAVRDLLAAGPGIACLVTTQRVLGLRGERVLELNTLPEDDAITLFAERARDVRANFVVDDNNRADVATLCLRLEGVPLAIELAAARCTVMTPRQIVDRLGERFRLLQSRSPDLAPRHRALLATIQWSYNLLPPDAQETLAQMSVFAGGFTMEDAEAVCETFDVFEAVDLLRHHSLLRMETDPVSQESRFLMLESVREFGEDTLRAVDNGLATFQGRHAAWFLKRATDQLTNLRTAGEGDALKRLDTDGDNVWAAVRRSSGQIPLFSELALVVGRWRHRRGFLGDAVSVVEKGLERLATVSDQYPALWSELLLERAGLHLDFDETQSASDTAERARSLSATRDDADGVAKAENLLGQAAMQTREFPQAREYYEHALDRFTQTGAVVEIAILRNNLGLLERRNASPVNPDEREAALQLAEDHLTEALRLRRLHGDKRGVAETLNNLGVIAFDRADWERAESFYKEAIPFEQAVGDTLGIARALYNLGEVAQKRGEEANESGLYAHAVRLFAVSERLFEEALSPLATDVAKLLSAAAAEADISTETVAILRTTIRNLPADQRIPFALAEGEA